MGVTVVVYDKKNNIYIFNKYNDKTYFVVNHIFFYKLCVIKC